MKSPKNPNRPRGGRPPKPETERLKRRLVVCLTETDYDALCRKARGALARSIARAGMTPRLLTLRRQPTGRANTPTHPPRWARGAGFGRDTATLAALVDRIDTLLTRIDQLP